MNGNGLARARAALAAAAAMGGMDAIPPWDRRRRRAAFGEVSLDPKALERAEAKRARKAERFRRTLPAAPDPA